MKYRLWHPDLMKAFPMAAYHGVPDPPYIGFTPQRRGHGAYCVRFNLGTSSPIQGVEYHFDAEDDAHAIEEALEIVAQLAADYSHDLKSAMWALGHDYRSITLEKTVRVKEFALKDDSVRKVLEPKIEAARLQLKVDKAQEKVAEETRLKEERRVQYKKLKEEFGE